MYSNKISPYRNLDAIILFTTLLKYQWVAPDSGVNTPMSVPICALSTLLNQLVLSNMPAGSTCSIPTGSSEELSILSEELNDASPHFALSVSPWPCQRLSWSSCSSLSTRLGLQAEFISRVNTWRRDENDEKNQLFHTLVALCVFS